MNPPEATARDVIDRPLEAPGNPAPVKLMENETEYPTPPSPPKPVKTPDTPDLIGAEAAMQRVAAKVIAEAKAAGVEPVTAPFEDEED